jgi:esterase
MQLHYQRYGEGDPLIILHGLFGSLANWTTISKKFAEQYEVWAVDQRNHGSSPHSDTMDYQAMADDLQEFVQSQQISSAHLLGHSMGGKTAMQFALTYPGYVKKLIVVDIAPKGYPRHHDEILDALCSLDLSAANSRSELDTALAQYISDAAVRQFLLTNAVRSTSGGFEWKMNLDAIKQCYDNLIAGIDEKGQFDKPALFIRGEKSDYIGEDDYRLIQTMFPQASIKTIAGAGHWVHAEAPETFYKIVSDFLRQ